MKHQRLDYSRLAEVLHERGIGNVDAIRELLQHSHEGGMPFCEALVTTNLVTDWDLSKIVCETFHLPFLPVDMVEPNPAARRDIDPAIFANHQVVPLDRFGQVLTVAMPALVQADVLAMISAATDLVVLPVVGTVETNRRWVTEHLSEGPAPDIEGGWGSLFDQADADVQASLDDEDEEGAEPSFAAPQPMTAEEQVQMSGADEPLDLGLLESLGDAPLEALEPEDEDDFGEELTSAPPMDDGSFELPPMPDFGGERQAG